MNTTAPTALTALDIAALRQANTVTFHHYWEGSYMRANLDLHSEAPTTKQLSVFPQFVCSTERARRIAVSSSVSGYFDDNSAGSWRAEPGDTAVNCYLYTMAGNSSYRPEWLTIVDQLRVGDSVRLIWLANNNNQVLVAAGLHCDEMRLEVTSAKGKVRTYLIERTVNPGNTARMIKRHG